jgi:hypothetical protein
MGGLPDPALDLVAMSWAVEATCLSIGTSKQRYCGLHASVLKWARTALTCSIESTLHRAADLKKMQESGSCRYKHLWSCRWRNGQMSEGKY